MFWTNPSTQFCSEYQQLGSDGYSIPPVIAPFLLHDRPRGIEKHMNLQKPNNLKIWWEIIFSLVASSSIAALLIRESCATLFTRRTPILFIGKHKEYRCRISAPSLTQKNKSHQLKWNFDNFSSKLESSELHDSWLTVTNSTVYLSCHIVPGKLSSNSSRHESIKPISENHSMLQAFTIVPINQMLANPKKNS